MKTVKILSLIFALVLMFSLCAVSVFADVETVNADAEEAEAAATEASAEEAEAKEDEGFTFEPVNFVHNLYYMGVGMFCIIVVIGVLILVTMALNRITAPKSKE